MKTFQRRCFVRSKSTLHFGCFSKPWWPDPSKPSQNPPKTFAMLALFLATPIIRKKTNKEESFLNWLMPVRRTMLVSPKERPQLLESPETLNPKTPNPKPKPARVHTDPGGLGTRRARVSPELCGMLRAISGRLPGDI